ncbi:5-formyltetrahydrofolate cyclo-ligase [Corticibacter populi]|uniref:5-formyltetrahydrofolate cyclo-ligase n=1 Tax=Corticibacter populi TaxID=1550736 RepID=A0A3M6QSC1_9BURK|nr:5-formyltetrahydrofolate cyclo-ligase [Corticibacter populi]RMX05924.1 5-formyltetrahydrofolate cyclo-ligase [Corticibacter populi]RZS30754.1 5-formyltetrahydrofolate cyclo-ligase [Corticibacter populi]
MSYHHEHAARWQGRHEGKDTLRTEVWQALERAQVNVGPVASRIPNFVGADAAAQRLAQTAFWQDARIVKCNPDPPQIPVRLRALYDGKVLYTPVPELVQGFPFVRLDPAQLKARDISFELAATSQGALQVGEPVQFEDMEAMDVVVVGCVAVTAQGGRTGKGGGFADLELGIFRELGTLPAHAQIVTTVHEVQVVPDAQIEMLAHDSALHWIFTPERSIETHSPYPQPGGVAWDVVQDDQIRDIPFLLELKRRLTAA